MAHVKARKLAPREKRRGVAQRKDTPEILSAPLAGNRTARKLHFFSHKNKKSKGFDFSNFRFFRLFRWFFSRKIKKCSTFRLFDFSTFHFFDFSNITLLAWERFDFLTFRFLFFVWFFDFSVFFRLFVFAFFDFSPFCRKKGKLWLMTWQFKTVSKFLKILNFANFSTI